MYPPTFSWDSPNLYSSFKLFKQKLEFAFKRQFKDCDGVSKVSTILNCLGDNAYGVYENLHWEYDAHKNEPDHVLKVFEKYFKPEQNQFHSWYTLGSIYSGQFKCQYDFLNRLKEVAHDCSFINADEIVCFLFLTHNQSTCVREELLISMKTMDSLQNALQITRLAEGTMHLEELSKQYLDTVKKDSQVDSIHKGKQHRKAMDVAEDILVVVSEAQLDLSLEDLVRIVVPNTLAGDVQLIRKHVIIAKRKDISPNFVIPELTLNLHNTSLEGHE